MPVEEIWAQIQRDFEDHILTTLRNVSAKEDWQKLYKEKCRRYEEKDICLLRYYSTASTLSCAESNLTGLIEMKRSCELSERDIKSHFDWLSSIVKQNPDDPYAFDRTVNFILRSLKQDHWKPEKNRILGIYTVFFNIMLFKGIEKCMNYHLGRMMSTYGQGHFLACTYYIINVQDKDV